MSLPTDKSQRKNGWRKFPEDALPRLLQVLNRQTEGLFKDIPPDAFLEPFDDFCQRLITAAVIPPAEAGTGPPLCEILSTIQGTQAVVELLKQKDHTFAWSQEFKAAFNLVPTHQERLVDLFYQTINESMLLRGRQHVLRLAAGTLTYAWEAFEGLTIVRNLGAHLESQISDLEPRFVFMADPCPTSPASMGSTAPSFEMSSA